VLTDLDALMRDRGIDTVVVPMHEALHASFRWLSRGAKITRGYAVQRAGAAPVLVAIAMEREEAVATGLEVRLLQEFCTPADPHDLQLVKMLTTLESGPAVAFFGNVPAHLYLDLPEALAKHGFRVHRANGEDLIQLARKRKDPREIEAIRSVGERTEQVVDTVRAMLREAEGGRVLTLGDLKRTVSQEIVRLRMIEDHETILSQGRDAGIPHSRGDASAPLRRSVPLVLDIFPADLHSGYFFDLTRTFCIGAVPDSLRRVHADVFEAFTRARDAVRPGTRAADYQALVCDLFEAKGYATIRSDPSTLEGYVHGLGHGVGLDIHENPSFSLVAANQDLIEEGDVITIEPGLYFPDRELGVRIEDTFVVTKDGVETLCRGDYALEP
jgi:Xaa-Pro aminopeptidase